MRYAPVELTLGRGFPFAVCDPTLPVGKHENPAITTSQQAATLMRISANSIKGRKAGLALQDKPREGTKLRALYDRALKGEWFTAFDLYPTNLYNALNSLKTYYDLELQWTTRKGITKILCKGIWEKDGLRSIQQVEEAIEITQGRKV